MKKIIFILITLVMILSDSSLFLWLKADVMTGNYITLKKQIKEYEDLISLNPDEYSLQGSEYEIRNSKDEVIAVFEIDKNGIGYNKTTGKPFVDQLDDGLYKIREIKPSKGFILDQEVYEVSLYANTHLPEQITVNTIANLYGKNSQGQYFANNQYKLWTTDYGIGVFECGICQTDAPFAIRNFGSHVISTSTSKILDRNTEAHRLVYKVLYYGRSGPDMWQGFSSRRYYIPFSTRDGFNYYRTNDIEALSAFITHVVLGRVYGKNNKWLQKWDQHGVSDYYNWVIRQPDAPDNFVVYIWENYQINGTQDMFYGFLMQPTDFAHKDLIVEAKTEFDPIRVVLTKSDKNDVKIQGAQFTVEYYSQQLESVEESNGLSPLRSWVFETDEKGIFRFTSDYLVSGDELFIVEGISVLLAGTYIISETKIPSGYIKAADFMIKVSSDVTKPIEFTDSSGKGRLETTPEEGYRLLELLEGYLTIEKESEIACHYPLSGAVYQVFLDEDCSKPAYINNSEEKAILITDENGKTATIGLVPGKYYVKEILAPENYYLDLNVYKIEVGQQETVIVKSIECPKMVSLKVTKKDEFSNPLQGAVFGLYDQNDELLLEKTTDENGVAVFENSLFVLQNYYLKEIKAPKGYILDTKKYQISAGEFIETIEKEVINHLVPETGDFLIYPFIIVMVISVISIFLLNESMKKYL